ncbi:threonine/serine exporter family protein [Aerococcaceae bacterium NML201209]|nr:threonine/serine exporter family protein [Aerococcaceae bacterium NML201209]
MSQVIPMNQHYKKISETAALAGKIMLESQAESYRVEDTVKRILQTSQLATTEVFANTTGLFMTLDDPSIDPITLVLRIRERGTHLRKIYRVNHISRQLTSGAIDIDEAFAQLTHVDEAEYTVLHKDISIFLLVVSFAMLLGGTMTDVLISGIAAILVILSGWFQKAVGMNAILNGTVATTLLGFCMPLILQMVAGEQSLDIIIVSALMPLFPGTAFTNGIRDTLKGDYVSGMAKLSEAVVIATSLAIGVALGLFLSNGVNV